MNITVVKSIKSFIISYLILKILSGDYPIGHKIPSENILAQRFKCSRLTARSAILVLEYIGALDSMRGAGHFVSEHAIRLLMIPLWMEKQSVHFTNRITNTGKKLISCETRYFDENNKEIGIVNWEIQKTLYLNIHKQYEISKDICDALIKSGTLGILAREYVYFDETINKPFLCREHYTHDNKFLYGVNSYFKDFKSITLKQYKKN
ncbi:MAG: GntR family transcriptional regulator [Mycoplasma sp.]|nr:GntR family transcriptional regulator [Mycoplasma sp.]